MLVILKKVSRNITYIVFYDENTKEFLVRFDIFCDIYNPNITCETKVRKIALYADYWKDYAQEIKLTSQDLIKYIEKKVENHRYKRSKLIINKQEFEKFIKEYISIKTALHINDLYFINELLQKTQ